MQVNETTGIMRTIAQGYIPREVPKTSEPITLMQRSSPSPLLYIHPAYINEYHRLEAFPEPPSLLERLEHEHARILAMARSNFTSLGCDDTKIPFFMDDPFGLAFLKNCTIEIHGVVRPKMADDVRTKAKLIVAAMLKHDLVKPVKFVINSPGGCASSMGSILDTMDMLKNTKINDTPITVATYLEGLGASAASLILANGTKGHRFMNPKAKIMIHQPLGGTEGQATNMAIDNQQLQELKSLLIDFFEKTTNCDREWLKKAIERDYWMWLSEAKERGFVDNEYNAFDLDELKDLDLNLVFATPDENKSKGCGC